MQSDLGPHKTTRIILEMFLTSVLRNPGLISGSHCSAFCAQANPPAHSCSSSIYPSPALGRALEPAKSTCVRAAQPSLAQSSLLQPEQSARSKAWILALSHDENRFPGGSKTCPPQSSLQKPPYPAQTPPGLGVWIFHRFPGKFPGSQMSSLPL